MAKYAYVLFNLAISSSLVFAVPWVPSFWAQWRNMLRGLAAVSLPFIIWDVLAAKAGHWSFNPVYVLGARVYGLPIEEILFFASVPLACMVVWTLLAQVRGGDRPLLAPKRARLLLLVAAAVLTVLALAASGKGYTMVALLAAAVTCVALAWYPQLTVTTRFMLFQVCACVLFVVCNTVLTSLPIIVYGPQAVTEWRVGTIPVEDFLYNFALLNLFLVVFNRDIWAPKSTKSAVL